MEYTSVHAPGLCSIACRSTMQPSGAYRNAYMGLMEYRGTEQVTPGKGNALIVRGACPDQWILLSHWISNDNDPDPVINHCAMTRHVVAVRTGRYRIDRIGTDGTGTNINRQDPYCTANLQ